MQIVPDTSPFTSLRGRLLDISVENVELQQSIRSDYSTRQCIPYAASDTNNAQKRTCSCGPFNVCNGERIIVNGCDCLGRSFLTLVQENGIVVQGNSPCSNTSTCSFLVYQHAVPSCINLYVNEGCSGSTACSASVLVRRDSPDEIAPVSNNDTNPVDNGTDLNINQRFLASSLSFLGSSLRQSSRRSLQQVRGGLVEQCAKEDLLSFPIASFVLLFLLGVSALCILAWVFRELRYRLVYLKQWLGFSSRIDENDHPYHDTNNNRNLTFYEDGQILRDRYRDNFVVVRYLENYEEEASEYSASEAESVHNQEEDTISSEGIPLAVYSVSTINSRGGTIARPSLSDGVQNSVGDESEVGLDTNDVADFEDDDDQSNAPTAALSTPVILVTNAQPFRRHASSRGGTSPHSSTRSDATSSISATINNVRNSVRGSTRVEAAASSSPFATGAEAAISTNSRQVLPEVTTNTTTNEAATLLIIVEALPVSDCV